MSTYHSAEHPQSNSRPERASKRIMRQERNSWRTSTAPAALSVALLTGLAMAVALGFRELVAIAMSIMAG